MLTLSYLPGSTRIKRAFKPSYLVLDTQPAIVQLVEAIHRLPTLVWDKHSMVEWTLPFLTDEALALTELEYGCMEIVSDALLQPEGGYFTYQHKDNFVLDAQAATRALMGFGRSIFAQLQHLRAYRNGHLFYKFHGWCGHYDVVLEETPEPL